MPRVQHDQTHFSVVHTLTDLFHQHVRHLVMCHVAPPQKHVCLVKHLVGKTLIGVVQSGQLNIQRPLCIGCLQKLLNTTVDAIG